MAGGSKSSSKPVDVTPEVFKQLQGPYASVIGQLLGFGPAQQGVAGNTGPGSGGAAFRSGGVQQQGLSFGGGGTSQGRGSRYTPPWMREGFQPGGSSSAGPGQKADEQVRRTGPIQGDDFGGFSPFGNPNDVLRGIPRYQGPMVAGIGSNEQQLLDLLMQQQTGGPGGSPSQQALQRFLSGQSAYGGQQTATGSEGDFMAQLRQNLGGGYGGQAATTVGYSPEGSMSDFTRNLQGAQQTRGYDPNEINPMMQAYIEATQRPVLESLEETLTRSLPGRFTEAGQFTQRGSGSSAFDRAAAVATRGAAQAQADIATRIGFETLESERGRQFTAQEGARQREAEAMAQELERRGMFGEAARARQDAALEAERGRVFEGGEAQRQREAQMLAAEQERRGAYGEAERGRRFQAGESAQDRALEAARSLPGVSRAEIDTTIANLQAQALPRLIEQLGIEQGIEQFQNQMNELLAILGIGAGVTAPVIGQESRSKTKPNILGAL